jgi:hypothetical protein
LSGQNFLILILQQRDINMGASVWNPNVDPVSTANADNTILSQSFTATQGQSLFNLTNFAYVPGTNSLEVRINGVVQYLTRDYLETSGTSFTVIGGVKADDLVDVIGIVGETNAQEAAISAAQAEASAVSAANSLAAMQQLQPVGLPLTVANGGTGATTAVAARANLGIMVTAKGDLQTHNAGAPSKLSVGADGQILVADSTAVDGLAYINAGLSTANVVAIGDVAWTASNSGSIKLNPINYGYFGILPAANTLRKQSAAFIFKNVSNYPYGIKDNAGTTLGWIPPNSVSVCGLIDNGSAAGEWAISNLSKVAITAEYRNPSNTVLGTDQVYLHQVDTNRHLIFFNSGTNYYGIVYDKSTKTWGAPVILHAGNGYFAACPGYVAGQLAVVLVTSLGALVVGTITCAGTTPSLTGTTPSLVTPTQMSTAISIVQFGTTTNFFIAYNTTDTVKPIVRCINFGVTGLTFTAGAELIAVNGSVNNGESLFALSVTDTQMFVLSHATALCYYTLYSLSGTTLSVANTYTFANSGVASYTKKAEKIIGATRVFAISEGVASIFSFSGAAIVRSQAAAITATDSSPYLSSYWQVASGKFLHVGANNTSNVYLNIFIDTAGAISKGVEISFDNGIGVNGVYILGVINNIAKVLINPTGGATKYCISVDVSGTSPVIVDKQNLNIFGASATVSFVPTLANTWGATNRKYYEVLFAGNIIYRLRQDQSNPVTFNQLGINASPEIYNHSLFAGISISPTESFLWSGLSKIQKIEVAA